MGSMKSMWSGSIGFGLVNIPVKMYKATEENDIHFHQLDKKDHARVKYKKVNENTGKELSSQDIIRGYDLDGQMVIVEDSDMAKAMPEKLDHLELQQFVDEREIDPVYYEQPYFLEPDKVGAKAYVLLRDSLLLGNRVGLGLLVFHNKEWLCLLKPVKKVMLLYKLRFPDEVRSSLGLNIPDITISKDELKMAGMLVESLTKNFNPEDYKDTYTEKLRGIIEAKAKGKGTGKTMKVVHKSTDTSDLMAKLKESLKKPSKKAS